MTTGANSDGTFRLAVCLTYQQDPGSQVSPPQCVPDPDTAALASGKREITFLTTLCHGAISGDGTRGIRWAFHLIASQLTSDQIISLGQVILLYQMAKRVLGTNAF
jgi:hypothetical protein